MSEDKFDTQRGYCRRLGHDVDFSYCRMGTRGIACFKIFDCWYERFDVREFMESHYTPSQIKEILAGSKDKVATLYDLIEKAKKINQAHSG